MGVFLKYFFPQKSKWNDACMCVCGVCVCAHVHMSDVYTSLGMCTSPGHGFSWEKELPMA